MAKQPAKKSAKAIKPAKPATKKQPKAAGTRQRKAAKTARRSAVQETLTRISAQREDAYEMLDVLRLQIASNDLLLENFPEICYPVR